MGFLRRDYAFYQLLSGQRMVEVPEISERSQASRFYKCFEQQKFFGSEKLTEDSSYLLLYQQNKKAGSFITLPLVIYRLEPVTFSKSAQQFFLGPQMEVRDFFYSSIMTRSPVGSSGSVKKQMSQSSSPSAARELWATPRGQVWN